MVRCLPVSGRGRLPDVAGGGNQLRWVDQMRKLTHLEKYHMNKASQRGTEKVVAVTPEAMEIESRAIERERRGHYRIAARLWLQCLDAAVGEVERARIAVRRQQCITKGNRTPHLDYSGIGCRGVVYD
nr:MAG TPA: PerC transcriptional activator [Caudoviricetes sp.]